ncbi:MAG: hypothetical protein AAF449_05490 [Myxococcota bacterium]
MAGSLDFDAANVRSVFQALVSRNDALRLQVMLRGPVTAMAERVVLRVAQGRVHLVRTADHFGVDALVRICLAEGGAIEVLRDPPPKRPDDATSFSEIFDKAETKARQIFAALEKTEGLGAVLRADLDQVMVQSRKMPDVANQVMRLADGRRTVAELLGASPYDEVMTARIVSKLYDVGVLTEDLSQPRASNASSEVVGAPPQWVMPRQGWGDTSELPGEDALEVEGPEVTGDVAQWLSAGDAPPPLMSDDAFAAAFFSGAEGEEAPTDRGNVPASAASSRPAIKAAPRASVGPLQMRIAGGAVVAVVAIGSFLVFGGQKAESNSESAAMSAARAAAALDDIPLAPEPDLNGPPEDDLRGPAPDALRRTIAPPDAPSDVREAESLWETGQYADAERLLRDLRRARRRDSTVFILSGQVFVDTGKLDLADAMANRALMLNRRSFRAWVLKGSVQQFKKNNRKALAAYRRALKLGPNHEMSDEIRSVVEQLENE